MKAFLNDVFWRPLQKLWHSFYAILDNLMVAVIILLAGWVVAKIIRKGVQGMLNLMRFERFAYRAGLHHVLSRAGFRSEPAAVLAQTVYYVVMFIFLVLALGALESTTINQIIAQVFSYLPKLVSALLIFFAGYLVSAFINRTVLIAAVNANLQYARALAITAQALVVIFFSAISLEQAGIGQGIVIATFSILFGGVVLALALAFGLGGRGLAQDILERRLSKTRQKTKRKTEADEISHL